MGKKTTPTRGPWQTLPEEVDRSYIRIRGTLAGSKWKIANVICCGEFDANEARANARLIEQAPAMYELLSDLTGGADTHDLKAKAMAICNVINKDQPNA